MAELIQFKYSIIIIAYYSLMFRFGILFDPRSSFPSFFTPSFPQPLFNVSRYHTTEKNDGSRTPPMAAQTNAELLMVHWFPT